MRLNVKKNTVQETYVHPARSATVTFIVRRNLTFTLPL